MYFEEIKAKFTRLVMSLGCVKMWPSEHGLQFLYYIVYFDQISFFLYIERKRYRNSKSAMLFSLENARPCSFTYIAKKNFPILANMRFKTHIDLNVSEKLLTNQSSINALVMLWMAKTCFKTNKNNIQNKCTVMR